MIRVGICSDKESISPTIEDYLKTRNCWYDLNSFSGELPSLFQYLEQDKLDLLFMEADSTEKMEAVRTIGRRLPGIRIILLTEKEEADEEDWEGIFFIAAISELKERMPDILDKYYIKERYLKRDRLIVNNKSRQIVVELKDVIYVERDRRNSIFSCNGEEMVTSTLDLSMLQEGIGRDDFVRCHNSYIVNLNYVKELCRNEFILKNGQKIPVSRRYLEEIRRRMKRWAESIW